MNEWTELIKKKQKLLLYCTKTNSRLFFDKLKQIFSLGKIKSNNDLNGKIVAECDFEVEDLRIVDDDPLGAYWYETKTLSKNEVLEKSCLTDDELFEYLGEDNEGYAIHIKNLHIFDEPKELSEYSKRIGRGDFQVLGNAPQNMMKCCEIKYMVKDYILISIRPQWMCLILNRIKDVEVRRVVLKEMLGLI